MKTYHLIVSLQVAMILDARTKPDAIRMAKQIWKEYHDITLRNREIAFMGKKTKKTYE